MSELPTSDSASRFRHELPTYVNQIAGCAFILIEDSTVKERYFRANSLRSIRCLALSMLKQVDDHIRWRGHDNGLQRDSVSGLQPRIRSTDLEMTEACCAIEQTSCKVQDRADFLADLAKIFSATEQIVRLVDSELSSISDTRICRAIFQ